MLFDNDNYYFYELYSKNNERLNTKYLRGNMFDNEFVPFGKMGYVKPNINNQELFDIMEASFAINDYNLYLDLHPEDREILVKYQNEVERLNKLSDSYTKKYGPLSLKDSDYNTFKWVETSFPWEVK